MTKILYGNIIAKKIRNQINKKVLCMKKKGQRPPHLATILVGNNSVSMTYVNNKIKDCENVGFKSSFLHLPNTITEKKLIKIIKDLNKDTLLDGLIIQLPLPKNINKENIIIAIDPDKDVDGFHPLNIGKMTMGIKTFIPATPLGILTLLNYYKINTQGKHIVIIGRSRIVGMPISILMAMKRSPGNSTVTLTHSYTQEIAYHTRKADIIITALGVPKFLKSNMIKKSALLIDVGISRVKDSTNTKGYKLLGDVDFDNVYNKVSSITPVPGGIGPITRSMLLKNTLIAVQKRKK
ncbi:MAG: bifunctional 5,10-methylenetetrahydrofolate dehydrogenase/5,10-methenyltetrahydrofolate cyclohydrolase [Candidatus Bostrichicola ureolyticus]|nr:MAG: bifunctional 5,10-methylenetetrahydrofolate dehydrogenase/5,10-methenyltetrahydrofolate cyclohydrolase [Candidatus Bostrichicola ureolyticus]